MGFIDFFSKEKAYFKESYTLLLGAITLRLLKLKLTHCLFCISHLAKRNWGRHWTQIVSDCHHLHKYVPRSTEDETKQLPIEEFLFTGLSINQNWTKEENEVTGRQQWVTALCFIQQRLLCTVMLFNPEEFWLSQETEGQCRIEITMVCARLSLWQFFNFWFSLGCIWMVQHAFLSIKFRGRKRLFSSSLNK